MEPSKYAHALEENPISDPRSIVFGNVDSFLYQHKQLLALLGDLRARRSKVSRGELWLTQRIMEYRERCKKLADGDPHIAALWRMAEKDIQDRFPDLLK